jgi:WD40 repeat protein
MDLADPGKPVPVKQALPADFKKALETLAFSPDGRSMAVAMRDQSVRVWDLLAAREIQKTVATDGRITRLLFSPHNRWLATYEVNLGRPGAILRGKVRLWDVASVQPLSQPCPHVGTFWDWQFAPNSGHLVVTVAQGNDTFGIQVWRLPTGESSPTKPSPSTEPVEAAFVPRGGG